jgi:hypothetical protein
LPLDAKATVEESNNVVRKEIIFPFFVHRIRGIECVGIYEIYIYRENEKETLSLLSLSLSLTLSLSHQFFKLCV